MSGVIEYFFNEIKNQFSTFIRVLCTDNVLEYVIKDVPSFCSKNSIIPYCYTSKQNGFVDRKQTYFECCQNLNDPYECSKTFMV